MYTTIWLPILLMFCFFRVIIIAFSELGQHTSYKYQSIQWLKTAFSVYTPQFLSGLWVSFFVGTQQYRTGYQQRWPILKFLLLQLADIYWCNYDLHNNQPTEPLKHKSRVKKVQTQAIAWSKHIKTLPWRKQLAWTWILLANTCKYTSSSSFSV